MKHDTVRLVNTPDETAQFGPHYALKGLAFGCHDVYLNPACPERCGNFETYEARADDNHPLRVLGLAHNRSTVGKSPEVVDLGICGAFDRQSDGISSRGYQQRPIPKCLAVLQMNALLVRIEGRDLRVQ